MIEPEWSLRDYDIKIPDENPHVPLRYVGYMGVDAFDNKLIREVLFLHYNKQYRFIGIFTRTDYSLKMIKFFAKEYPKWRLNTKDITQLSPAELRGMPQCQKFLNKMKKAKEKWR